MCDTLCEPAHCGNYKYVKRDQYKRVVTKRLL